MSNERYIPAVTPHAPLLRVLTCHVALPAGMVDPIALADVEVQSIVGSLRIRDLLRFKAHSTTVHVKDAGAIITLIGTEPPNQKGYELPEGPCREMLPSGYDPHDLRFLNASAVDTTAHILLLAEYQVP